MASSIMSSRRANSDGRRVLDEDERVPQPHLDFSVDDGGMDEYDVADEHMNMFEYVNPDNMTYEELLALQERIGFVSKGLPLSQIEAIPKIRRKDVFQVIQCSSPQIRERDIGLANIQVVTEQSQFGEEEIMMVGEERKSSEECKSDIAVEDCFGYEQELQAAEEYPSRRM